MSVAEIESRHPRSRPRGSQRHDTDLARSLALFDTLDVRKRNRQIAVYLTQDVYDLVSECAKKLGIRHGAAAAFLIEKSVRQAIEAAE